MPYRRTSSLFTTAATAATATTTAVARLSATAATSATSASTAVPRLSTAVSVLSAATALALAAPAASAAPIPLPHVRSGDGITGVGHHAPAAQPGAAGRHAPASHHASATQPAPAGNDAPAGQRTPAGQPGPAGHRPPTGQDAPAPYLGSVDHLTLTVRGTGSAATDGTFELYCHPARGNHPQAKKACEKLDGMTRWGRDPFAPVPQGVNCTMIYGGPATAHVSGTWAGRPVNADFRRTNGCEISRWSTFEPLLPSTSS
ncbi:SSI family serine proteinase inhibitor [Streptomyces sp. Isolate_219]|uniref:SSI family serine proteinase inhibitor n=1 Tax=Streptomyces sp. Isolate_219 TaxID=2950110 RepID=UPI0029057F08|nr:SSI family serine proteinase inhibitor [Streptomyces sp. Isolate_219]